MTRILVTGADGFVGRAVCLALADENHAVIAGSRQGGAVAGATELRPMGELADATPTDYDRWVGDVDAIVHLAARAHVMDDRAADPLAAFRRINVDATRLLADAARRAGIRRLLFLSSAKVNGEATMDTPFTEEDPPGPDDSYGQSKWEAERILRDSATDGPLETVILRPPLVYGPGVRANFLSLLKLCDTGLPLPFGGLTKNRRSLIYVKNLALAICHTIDHPAAGGKTYLVSDGPAVSTADLVGTIRMALGRPARLIHLPPTVCRGILTCAGKGAAADRLIGSLVVDDSRIRQELDWQPPFSFQAGMRETIDWYRRTCPNGKAP